MTIILNFLLAFWHTTTVMAPWLLFGFLMAGLLSTFFSPAYVQRHLGDKGWRAIVKAALFGVPLPLCSCGVVPVALALKKQGASRGATTAFLISTPQTGVDSFIVTWSMLGWLFAGFKVITAFLTGIIGGTAVEYFSPQPPSEALPADATAPEPPRNRIYQVFHYAYVTLFDGISGPLLVGLILAALIDVALPPELWHGYTGNAWLQMLLMLLIGIPLYVCSTASIPIAAALMLKGMCPGAALVFLIAGPATNTATLAAIVKILGIRATVIYLSAVAIPALVAGALLNHLAPLIPGSATATNCHEVGSSNPWLAGTAVVLLVLLLLSFVRRWMPKPAETPAGGNRKVSLKIDGMSCQHCRQSTENALRQLPGVTAVNVSLNGAVLFFADRVPDRQVIEDAVKNAGFELREMTQEDCN